MISIHHSAKAQIILDSVQHLQKSQHRKVAEHGPGMPEKMSWNEQGMSITPTVVTGHGGGGISIMIHHQSTVDVWLPILVGELKEITGIHTTVSIPKILRAPLVTWGYF